MTKKLVSFDDQAEPGEGLPAAVKAELKSTYVPEAHLGTSLVKVQAPQPPMLQRVVAEPQADNPRFLDKHGEVLYGMKGGAIYTSLDGTTWAQVNATWPGTGMEAIIHRIVPTADGEMLAMSPHQLRKSSGWSTNPATATWSASKIVPNGSCEFNGFGLDGDGQKFIIAEYSPTQSLWADSRYAHISTDAGSTWVAKYDTLALHGSAATAESHIHGVCYDRWADRFYVSEGHGAAGGVYGSTTDGAGWEGPLRVESTSAVGTNGPTVLVATDDGLVMGSDNEENGLFGIPRRASISDQRILRTWRMHTGRAALHTFAQRGWRDPDSGLVYVTFRSEYDDTPITVAAGTAGGGGLVYEHPLPARAGWDRFVAVSKIGADTLFFYAEIDGQAFHMRGTLTAPGGSDVSLVDRGNTMGGTTRDESSLAVGRSRAGGIRSLSMGQGARVGQYGAYSMALGSNAYANSVGAVVVGDGATGADGAANIAVIGYLAKGMSSGATAIGNGAEAWNAAVAIGLAAQALSGSVSLGANAVTTGNYALAIGDGAKALTRSIAIGRNADASGVLRSVVIGDDLVGTDNDQVKFGPKHIELGVLTADPLSPGYNDVREYYRRNGAGKVEKVVKFADGSVVVVATQP